MKLCRVVGTLWATRKDEKLEGFRFLVLRELGPDRRPLDRFVIGVDLVQAGVGDLVLIAQSSAARQTHQTDKKPVDAVVMAVVDDFEVREIQELEEEYRRRAAPLLAELGETAPRPEERRG